MGWGEGGGGRIIHTEGGPHTRRGIHKAVHTQGGLWPPQESCYLKAHRQGGTHRRRWTQKAEQIKGGLWPPREATAKVLHTEGSAHTRWSVATAGVMLFKGPQARRYTEGGAHTRWNTPKGGMWPLQVSCYLGGHRHGGTHRRRCTHKAEQTKGHLWPPHEATCKVLHTEGGAHMYPW